MRSLNQAAKQVPILSIAAALMLFFCKDAVAASVLEDPVVTPAGEEIELRINFSTPVRYLRHFPESGGNALRVTLELIDPCVAEELTVTETRVVPVANGLTPSTITFPESIKPAGVGMAICPVTRGRVDVSQTLLLQFDRPATYRVRTDNGNRTIVVTMPVVKSSEPLKAVQLGLDKNEAVQPALPAAAPVDLLTSSRKALVDGDAARATQLLNQLLNMPANEYTQEAQELAGVAREKSGDVRKAKAEYKLYLKLFPEGEGANRVRQRLAVLETIKDEPRKSKEPAPKQKKSFKEISQNTVTGSVSQYYYAGKSQSYTTVLADTTKTRSTDQSTLMTNMDINGRFRHNQYDTKAVFRDTQTHNMLPGQVDRNTVSAAYVEHENKEVNYMFRLGRQSGTSGGVLGRFDGLFGKYALNDKWRLTAVAGVPDYGSHNTVETTRWADAWTGHNEISLERTPILFYVDKFYTSFTPFILWACIIYVVLQIIRSIVDRVRSTLS